MKARDRVNQVESNTSAESSVANGRPAGVLFAGGILDQIVEAKSERLRVLKESGGYSVGGSKSHSEPVNKPDHLFAEALSHPGINIIAEIKRRSPSKGIIREDFDPIAIASSYAAAGAAALSVLTEEDFFGGSLSFLEEIANRFPSVPILRKDFIIDEVQLEESKLSGADAVLLITSVLEQRLLSHLIVRAESLGLDALVEVHNRAEMERAVDAGARLIGVNNRDLTDFTVSLGTSVKLASFAPSGAILVTESGIASGADVNLLKASGFSAFLIGEHFMRAPDPGSALRALVADAEAGQAVHLHQG